MERKTRALAGLKAVTYTGGEALVALPWKPDFGGCGIVPGKSGEGKWLNGLFWLDLYRKRWCWMLAIRCRGCRMRGIFGLSLM
jgi:hypothetical protein